MENLQNYIDKLNKLNFKEMYEGDFFLTWEKTDDELEAVFTIADALRYMREHNISTKIFESGLGISPVPRQLHPHPLLLRLRLQPAGPGGAGSGRGQEPDRPRRDRPRDRQHGVLHGRRHRHPRRHVHRQGQRLHARVHGRRDPGPQGRRAGAEAHPGQPPVRHRPPHPGHG